MILRPPRSTRTDTLVPYTTLFRSVDCLCAREIVGGEDPAPHRLHGSAAAPRHGQALQAAAPRPILGESEGGGLSMTARVEFFFDLSSPWTCLAFHNLPGVLERTGRSAERRVGKECGSQCRFRWSP